MRRAIIVFQTDFTKLGGNITFVMKINQYVINTFVMSLETFVTTDGYLIINRVIFLYKFLQIYQKIQK